MALPTPIAYWPCNEASGTTIADASGNGHTATLDHGTWDTSALKKFGAAALANTDGGKAGSFTPFSIGTVYTIAFWMSGWDGGNDGVMVDVYINATDLYHANGTWGHGGVGGSTPQHIVISRNGANASYYRNGIFYSTSTVSGSNSLNTLNGVSDDTYPFVGTLDDIRIYDVALTSTQVTELFNFNPDSPAASILVTQDIVELLSQPFPAIRTTQYVVELLGTSVSTAPPSTETTQFVIIM